MAECRKLNAELAAHGKQQVPVEARRAIGGGGAAAGDGSAQRKRPPRPSRKEAEEIAVRRVRRCLLRAVPAGAGAAAGAQCFACRCELTNSIPCVCLVAGVGGRGNQHRGGGDVALHRWAATALGGRYVWMGPRSLLCSAYSFGAAGWEMFGGSGKFDLCVLFVWVALTGLT